jgi:predicted deacylase
MTTVGCAVCLTTESPAPTSGPAPPCPEGWIAADDGAAVVFDVEVEVEVSAGEVLGGGIA